jgi:AcrR family transcriptional regulator
MSTVHDADDFSNFADAVRRRRLPSQARSRERVQRLLDTADHLIGADGLSTLTVPQLAIRAAIPVGSIYQFFPDKSAVVDAVAARYMQRSLEILEQLVDRIVTLRWEAAVDTVIEHFARMYRDNPTFCELWLNGRLSADARQRDRRNNDELAQILAEALKRRPEFHGSRRLKLASRMAVEIADGLLRYAFTLDPGGDQPTINELKRVVSGYLLEHAAPAHREKTGTEARVARGRRIS